MIYFTLTSNQCPKIVKAKFMVRKKRFHMSQNKKFKLNKKFMWV